MPLGAHSASTRAKKGDLHAELNGLLFTAFLFASIHPNADEYDVG